MGGGACSRGTLWRGRCASSLGGAISTSYTGERKIGEGVPIIFGQKRKTFSFFSFRCAGGCAEPLMA